MNIIAYLRQIHQYLDNGKSSFYYRGYVGVKDSTNLPPTKCHIKYRTDNYNGSVLDDFVKVYGGIVSDNNGLTPWITSIIPLTNIPKDWYKYHIYGFSTEANKDAGIDYSTNLMFAIEETMNMKKQIESLLGNDSSTGE